MLNRSFHILGLLAAGLLCLGINSSHANDPSVEINFETLNSLGSVQSSGAEEIAPTPPANNRLRFNKELFSETLSPAKLQNIEPAAGRAANLKTPPIPKNKPLALAISKHNPPPIPSRAPVRGKTPKTLVALKNIGRKPARLKENTPPAPVSNIIKRNLLPAAVQSEGEKTEQILAAIDPSLIKSTVEEKAENIAAPGARSNERKQAGSIQRIFLSYKQGQMNVPDNIGTALSPDIIAEISYHAEKRLSIYAYATSEESNESEARRIALARALGLREFLISKSIDPKRIDIHPMGLSTEPLKKDRVEIVLEDPGAASSK